MSGQEFDPALDARIPCGPRAPSDARRAVTELAARLHPGLLHDIQLLVSELVTNSVRHSGSRDPIRLRVWARRGGVRVEVADGGYGFETKRDVCDDDGIGGRGLLILETIADRWGVGDDVRGRVWFELVAGTREPRPQAG